MSSIIKHIMSLSRAVLTAFADGDEMNGLGETLGGSTGESNAAAASANAPPVGEAAALRKAIEEYQTYHNLTVKYLRGSGYSKR